MMKNSPSRISKRRQCALVRRKANIKYYNQHMSEGAYTTEEQIATVKRRIGVAETDVANLEKKGVRV